MSSDANWLLSSAAQSAAALVAIVGGFLVSRLVSLQAERSGLEARLSEQQAELSRQQGRLNKRDDTLLRYDLKTALEFAESQLASNSADLSPELVRGAAESARLGEEPVRQHLTAAVAAVQDLRAWLGSLADAGGPWPTWEQALAHLQPPEEFHRLLKTAHARELQRMRPASQQSAFQRILRDTSSVDRLLTGTSIGLRPNLLPPREQLVSDVAQTEATVTSLMAARAKVESPPGLLFGFLVLCFFAASGIGFPIVLMATLNRQDIGSGWRTAVAVAFLTGLSAVMTYLGWLLWQTNKAPPKPQR